MPSASVKPDVFDNRVRSGFPVQARIAIAVAIAFAIVAFIAPKLQPGPFVPQVTVVNHTEFSYDLAVTSTFADDSMPLGTAVAKATTTVAVVYDQGSTWTFHFTSQGRSIGQIVESEAALSSAGWRIVIPDRFAAKLRSDGLLPTA